MTSILEALYQARFRLAYSEQKGTAFETWLREWTLVHNRRQGLLPRVMGVLCGPCRFQCIWQL